MGHFGAAFVFGAKLDLILNVADGLQRLPAAGRVESGLEPCGSLTRAVASYICR